MVVHTYTCDICKTSYQNIEDAVKCEEKGLIGPSLKPGLLFSHKDVCDGFMLLYNELASEGHDRTYHLEEIISNEVLTYCLQDFSLLNSELKERIVSYRLSTKEELDRFNKLIQEGDVGTRGIKIYMNRYNIKELHNECNLDDLL